MRRRAVLWLAMVLVLAAPTAAVAQPTRTIATSGQARLELPNDAARVVLGINVRRRTAVAAIAEVGRRSGRVLGALARGGVARVDIATLGVSVSRVFRRRRFLGFDAGTTVKATVRQARSVPTLVPAVLQAGATSVNDVSFFLSNRRAAFRFALGAAMDDSREKAAVLASHAGLVVGVPLEVRESNVVSDIVPAPERAAGGGGTAPAPVRIPTRPGVTTVQADVTALWEALPAP